MSLHGGRIARDFCWRSRVIIVLLAIAWGGGILAADPQAKAAEPHERIRFNRDVRPILSETCFHCHGPDEHAREAGLRLDTPEGAAEDRGGYQAIQPGDLAESEAWQRIVSEDPDLQMPPPDSNLVLTADQQATLRRWIEQGAGYEGHWAFAAPVQPEVPDQGGWGDGPIDAFIAESHQQQGLKPNPQADPRTLLRRLTLDLTGLLPEPADISAFLQAWQQDREVAWQDAITRLMDSRHFGERMAVPWLDQARYADTNGYSIDGGREMWLYRDWVIQAYNRNLPFDQFLTEQLAGDLLPGATEAQRIASGFNRNHMVTHEGGTIPAENLTNYAADRVKTTSEVFLGLTMGCAQCHDHKYDPISQRDYYQFFAFFNTLSDRGLDGNAGQNPVPAIQAQTVLPKDEVAEVRRQLAAAEAERLGPHDAWQPWLQQARQEIEKRGQGFVPLPLEVLDVSSPNRPGPFEIQPDSSILVSKPTGGLNAFSHAVRLPDDTEVSGIRIAFHPHAGDPKQPQRFRLTPHRAGVPQVTTVLVSAGEQPAKQVDIYRQVGLKRATASSAADGFEPDHVLDERNVGWWKPTDPAQPQHLTLTFDKPIDSSASPYLSVMVFYGVGGSLPYRWSIDGFVGRDPDSRFSATVTEALAVDSEDWSDEQRAAVEEAFRQGAEALAPLRAKIANLRERLEVLTKRHQTMVMDTAARPRPTFILARGQYDARLEAVRPDTPAVLPPLPAKPLQPPPPMLPPLTPWAVHPLMLPVIDAPRYDRLDLARWMTDPQHPLTARVAVNRLWALFFGRGLVASSADFGSQGQWPSHPELLDYLATDFVAHGWDQKRLIRQIVSSATYRQNAAPAPAERRSDPDNRWLARGPRFRLPAEFIRDITLQLSGLLVPRIGGPSVQPYQPHGLWKEVSHFGSTPATKQVFVRDSGEKLYRRSLYTIVKRTSPHPAMSAFDAPNREMCVVQRSITNTPLQALVTLNDPQFVEASRHFAARFAGLNAPTEDTAKLQSLFAAATCRLPQAAELQTLKQYLAKQRQRFQADRGAAESLLAVGASAPTRGDDPAELAAWTQVASLVLNLSETLTRN